MEGRSCETPGCEQPAKLQCPTCIKLGIQVIAEKTARIPAKHTSSTVAKYFVWGTSRFNKANIHDTWLDICFLALRVASSATSNVSRLIGICIRLVKYTLCSGYILDLFRVSMIFLWSGSSQVGKDRQCISVFKEGGRAAESLAGLQFHWKTSAGGTGVWMES